MNKSKRDLQISIPPPRDHRADFLKPVSVPVQIVNDHSRPVLIQSIALQFQSDMKVSAAELTIEQNCEGLAIESGRMGYQNVTVTPHLYFRQYTNVFQVVVSYRRQNKRGLGNRLKQSQRDLSHLVVQPAPNIYGNIFISYKEPENRALAELLLALGKAAGFTPYIAPADMKPGSKIWREKIPQAIKASKATFVIWTSEAPFGKGVRREIKISRRNGVPDILLLEEGVKPPLEHKGTDLEWTPFTRDNAAAVFANVLRSYRENQDG